MTVDDIHVKAMVATQSNRLDDLKALHATGELDLEKVVHDTTFLYKAVSKGFYAVAKWLLDQGADPNNGYRRQRPLYRAANSGSSELIDLLLHYGAKADAKGATLDDNAAHVSALRKEAIPLTHLLDGGIDPRIKRRDGMSLLKISSLPMASGDDGSTRAVVQRYLDFPVLPEDGVVSKAELLALTDKGGLLDNPLTWKRIEEVLQGLEAGGEHLTTAELMQTNNDGKPWLFRAAACMAFKPLIAHLNAHGEYVNDKTLLNEDGKLTEIGEYVCQKYQAPTLFVKDNWQADVNAVSRLYYALPESSQNDISNYNAIKTAVRLRAAQEKGGGLAV